jgi:hypothetical protein
MTDRFAPDGTRYVAIDGFCCAGGAGRGLTDAGFEVYGVDINPQPNYPYRFAQGDVLEVVPRLVAGLVAAGRSVVLVHNSPPCQANIAITAANRTREGWTDDHVNLIPDTRAMNERLRTAYGVATSVENGVSDELRRDLMLCGQHFRLATYRHRYFELDGFAVPEPKPHRGLHTGHRTIGWRHNCLVSSAEDGRPCPKHGVRHSGTVYGVYGDGGGKPSVAESQVALGLYHTDVQEELNEAIPPAYARHLGLALQAQLAR